MGRVRQLIAGRKAFEAEVQAQARIIAEAYGPNEPDDFLYRAQGLNYRRDMRPVDHQKGIEVAFQLYQQNPLAHRILSMNRDFIVGDGITYSCSNPDVTQVVDDFWNDPNNNLDQRVHDFALELGLFGELAPEAFVGDVSGIVQLGYIDAAQIDKVPHVPGNPLIPDQLTLRQDAVSDGVTKTLDIIRHRPKSSGGIEIAGDVFYFHVNGVSNSTRGWSDLVHIADWLDIYDQMLWDMLERAKLMRLMVWDVAIQGGQISINDWLKTHRHAPRPGTINAHNENETWQAMSPDLGSAETVAEADKILEHIAVGSGYPKTWFSSPESVNRASASAMEPPTYRMLAARQRYFLGCLKQMIEFALQQAANAGVLKVDSSGEVPIYDEDGKKTADTSRPVDLVTLNAPEIAPKDVSSISNTLSVLASGLAVMEDRGWVGKRPVADVLEQIFGMLGVDYDPTDIMDGPDDPYGTAIANLRDELLAVSSGKGGGGSQ